MKQYELNWDEWTQVEEDAFNANANNFALISRIKDESEWSYAHRMKAAEGHLREAGEKIKSAIIRDDALRAEVEHAYNSRFRNYVKPNYDAASYLIRDVMEEISKNVLGTLKP
jgi:hypothetical protein